VRAYFVHSAPTRPCKCHTHIHAFEWYHLTPTVYSNMHTTSDALWTVIRFPRAIELRASASRLRS
jgi:hypothetical protein